jgi:hypothetical protein
MQPPLDNAGLGRVGPTHEDNVFCSTDARGATGFATDSAASAIVVRPASEPDADSENPGLLKLLAHTSA